MDVSSGNPNTLKRVGRCRHERHRAAQVDIRIDVRNQRLDKLPVDSSRMMVVAPGDVGRLGPAVGDRERYAGMLTCNPADFCGEGMMIAVARAVYKRDLPVAAVGDQPVKHADHGRHADSRADEYDRTCRVRQAEFAGRFTGADDSAHVDTIMQQVRRARALRA